MDVNKCLPPELTVESVDDILYRIGLSFDSIRDRPKRKLIDHPLIVFIIISIFTAQRLITTSLSSKYEFILRLLGDTGHFLDIRYFDAFYFLCSTLLISQLIYYNNYRNGIKPTFLRVFQMMSGLVSPKRLGLTDERQVIKLIQITKKLKTSIHFNNNYLAPNLAFIFIIAVYLLNCQLSESFYFGFPNALITGLWVYYFWNFVGFQFMCFYICLYLKFKINSLNERLIEMKRRMRFIRIRETLQSFDSLYSEINEYNTTFWSKFLFIFWLTYGLNVILFLYITIFIEMSLILKVIFGYTLTIFLFSFLFVIFTASSVTYCANKSYKTLHSFIVSFSKHNKHFYYTKIYTKLKVVL